MVSLWDLPSKITDPAFGSKDIFHDRSEEDDLLLQRNAEKVVPELQSGRYDAALAAASRGNVGSGAATFRSLLAQYRGPITAAEAAGGFTPELVNAEAYRFSHFVAPAYPPLAKQARVQGEVRLQLTLDRATGEVLDVAAVSGHALLKPPAIYAAQQWRFKPNSTDYDKVDVTIEFPLRCQ
jgi:TonB family protein